MIMQPYQHCHSEPKSKNLKTLSLPFLIAFYVLSFTLYASAADQPVKFEASGPLNIRNQMPLYLFYMAPSPQKAHALKKGKIKADVSYHVSNVIIQQRPWPAEQFVSSYFDKNGEKSRR